MYGVIQHKERGRGNTLNVVTNSGGPEKRKSFWQALQRLCCNYGPQIHRQVSRSTEEVFMKFLGAAP